MVDTYDHGLFKKLDGFLEEWDNGEIEAKPDPEPTSPTPSSHIFWQLQLATSEKLTAAIGSYRTWTRDWQAALDSVKLQNMGKAAELAKHFTGSNVEELRKKLNEILIPELQEPLLKRWNSAAQLEGTIDEARSCGLIKPTEVVRKKYKQCLEDNEKLSKQILEYKAQHKL